MHEDSEEQNYQLLVPVCCFDNDNNSNCRNVQLYHMPTHAGPAVDYILTVCTC